MTVAAPHRPGSHALPDGIARRAANAVSGTPGRLGLAQIASVLACVALGISGFLAGTGQSADLDVAHADAVDLVATQDLRNHLVSADAAATSAFLVGGLEPTAMRERYTANLAAAARAVPPLAARTPERAEELAAVSDAVQRYSGLVESARANNRQGLPVGTGYLDLASATLRDEALPVLDDVAENITARMDGHLAAVSMRQTPLLVAVAGLVVLGLVQWWLAHRTHRMISPWMVVATALALVGCLAVAIGVIGGNVVARKVADGPYAATVATSAALAEATDAKSQESLTLIKRGSGQEHEDRFQDSTARAAALLSVSDEAAGDERPTGALLRAWLDGHAEIRELDDAGRWEEAVSAAIATDDGSSLAAFEDFADRATRDVAVTGERAAAQLTKASAVSSATGWIALVAGLLAAGMTATGIWARQKEYL
ncbi:hypothetical protein [Myceligenerans pegani]|uniref:Secreted protein n=1 Tax=Myceligenerans pegani TaxID=2776917 RepID=A0ABR9N2T7_9MICO|nr:hypothetical protein [Myceligenerans sp. TRM 65318]MBE1877327.1 hypothetical protein [Myceligenerans sp. TRM 65318]MBE3019598.1 hypothetical protein [Myceligenerans sp. TRM 65318]